MKSHIKTAEIILSALPYIQKFRGQVFVIKYGGAAQTDEGLKSDFARDIVLLQLVGIKVVIVHGGGKKINSLLDKLNIESHFEDGLRVTNKDTMEVVEMALSGLINKEITSLLVAHGARAVGISGKDEPERLPVGNAVNGMRIDNGLCGQRSRGSTNTVCHEHEQSLGTRPQLVVGGIVNEERAGNVEEVEGYAIDNH